MAALNQLLDAVRAAAPVATTATAIGNRAVSVWCALHGIVILRHDRPEFGWPPIPDLIDTLLPPPPDRRRQAV